MLDQSTNAFDFEALEVLGKLGRPATPPEVAERMRLSLAWRRASKADLYAAVERTLEWMVEEGMARRVTCV